MKPENSKLVIKGGSVLSGAVRTSGAKNSVLKLMAACLLVPDEILLSNVPPLQDVCQMIEILEFLGASCDYDEQAETLKVNAKHISSTFAPYDLVSRLRASFVILGPLLARMGEAKVSLPGGCQIGSRRIDLHEKGLKEMGAKLEINHGYVEGEVSGGKLKAAKLHLDIPSNGATENLMMAAVLAEGTTVIDNAARDPEIEDLANFLIACGAKIEGAGTSSILIHGVSVNELHGTAYSTLPDRIEAGTFLIAGLATKGSVTATNISALHMNALLSKLKEMNAKIDLTPDSVQVSYQGPLKPAEISTVWYPGFPTDMQPQISALLTIVEGTSIIKESIYEDRFSHIEELVRMGADAQVSHGVAVMKGVESLSGAKVVGSDLRATAGLAIAALVANGYTEVQGLGHLDRGYSHFTAKLLSLGAQITRSEITL